MELYVPNCALDCLVFVRKAGKYPVVDVFEMGTRWFVARMYMVFD